jgi:uncharacterized protein YeaO (DUF488 family)
MSSSVRANGGADPKHGPQKQKRQDDRSDKRRSAFRAQPGRFTEFSLSANKDAVGRMEELVKAGPVTLLYAAHDEGHNNARVLAEYLKARV